MLNRKIRYGMVGGGRGAFIGAVHRIAAAIDGQLELVCGCFSSDAERSKASGADLFLPENRVYSNFTEMMEKEAELPEDERMDLVSIVTPNSTHFPVAKAALENGFHVVSDKPATIDLAEAIALREIVRKTGLMYGLTHNYTGYPMVKAARQMVAEGSIGKVRKIVVEYPQGWLATRLEESGQKQANWRTDPSIAGASCCMGDIGTHAENLAEYITGLKITEMCAEFTTFVDGRPLEDDGNVLVRFEQGAKGILHASQISVGEENNLNIRIYGETGGLEWHQVEPNTLLVKHPDRPTEIFRAGQGYLSGAAAKAARTPPGHPEGYLEAFATIYRNFAHCLSARLSGDTPDPDMEDFPGIDDAVRGMAFLDTVVRSANSNDKWTAFTET